jgi:hypothetical protein
VDAPTPKFDTIGACIVKFDGWKEL